MKAIIIASGDLNNFKINFSNYNFIVAADGGANHCLFLKIKPDIIIGDFDSISKDALKKFKKIKKVKIINQEKTDLEKAINYLKDKKFKKIDILATTSINRIDHTLANIFLLKKYANLSIKIISKNSTLEIISGRKKLNNLKNKTISLFPLGNIKLISLKGFKWNKIKDYSISNVVVSNRAEINVGKGKVILVINNGK